MISPQMLRGHTMNSDYLLGLDAAYADCARIADRLAAEQPSFADAMVRAGFSRTTAELAAHAAETALEEFSEAIRAKMASHGGGGFFARPDAANANEQRRLS